MPEHSRLIFNPRGRVAASPARAYQSPGNRCRGFSNSKEAR